MRHIVLLDFDHAGGLDDFPHAAVHLMALERDYAEMDPMRPRCTPGLRFYQWMMEKDRAARLRNQRRLRALNRAHSGEVSIFCGHDIREFERLSGQSARVPADRMARQPQAAPA